MLASRASHQTTHSNLEVPFCYWLWRFQKVDRQVRQGKRTVMSRLTKKTSKIEPIWNLIGELRTGGSNAHSTTSFSTRMLNRTGGVTWPRFRGRDSPWECRSFTLWMRFTSSWKTCFRKDSMKSLSRRPWMSSSVILDFLKRRISNPQLSGNSSVNWE